MWCNLWIEINCRLFDRFYQCGFQWKMKRDVWQDRGKTLGFKKSCIDEMKLVEVLKRLFIRISSILEFIVMPPGDFRSSKGKFLDVQRGTLNFRLKKDIKVARGVSIKNPNQTFKIITFIWAKCSKRSSTGQEGGRKVTFYEAEGISMEFSIKID